MTYSGDDFYCDMALSGKVDIKIVDETEHVLAFHHTSPFWPVHIVVIPKAHVPSFTNLGEHDEETLLNVIRMAQKIAKQLTEEHGAAAVLTNLGTYQDSKHLHFHVTFGEPLNTKPE
ncbi:MAG: HIT domain-containing protein [OCS116 cluster bacterium]|nr:HIT domain-containing protein [OCS116 cluster bacterium]